MTLSDCEFTNYFDEVSIVKMKILKCVFTFYVFCFYYQTCAVDTLAELCLQCQSLLVEKKSQRTPCECVCVLPPCDLLGSCQFVLVQQVGTWSNRNSDSLLQRQSETAEILNTLALQFPLSQTSIFNSFGMHRLLRRRLAGRVFMHRLLRRRSFQLICFVGREKTPTKQGK